MAHKEVKSRLAGVHSSFHYCELIPRIKVRSSGLQQVPFTCNSCPFSISFISGDVYGAQRAVLGIVSLLSPYGSWISNFHTCVWVVFCFFFFFFSETVSMWPWLTWNCLCRPSWLQIHGDPPASGSWVLWLKPLKPWATCLTSIWFWNPMCPSW